MANHKSSKKRIRRNERARVVNHARKSRMRSYVKNVEVAIEAGDKKAAEAALQNAQPEIHRAATKGVMHKNTAARMISRLAKGVNNIGA